MKKNKALIKAGMSVSKNIGVVPDAFMHIPHITLSGNLSLNIENFKNIIEYAETFITVNTVSYPIKISGEKLEIDLISGGTIKISGTITSLEFIC